ncbi:LysR substrate-binding domain-containing protein [Kutzneria viridogrisea]|uniref:LysR substrate-binding domain-containing protein n=1 Tax=Kutzneria viridogrisea TaxID=47990 RepID=UPI00398D43B6
MQFAAFLHRQRPDEHFGSTSHNHLPQSACGTSLAYPWRRSIIGSTIRDEPLAGFDSEELLIEEQVAILPAEHPLAARTSLSVAEVSEVPDLPLARWPRHDGTYPPGPGPEIHDQSQLAQLIALGRTMVVIPASGRAWLWTDHVAVPVTDAPLVTTLIAWPPHSRSPALARLIRTAARL